MGHSLIALDSFPPLTSAAKLYLRPLDLCAGDRAEAMLASGNGRLLAGGRLAFSETEVLMREPGRPLMRTQVSAKQLHEWAGEYSGASAKVHRLVEFLASPRMVMKGADLDQPIIMGIINVTPDSFSDGGFYFDTKAAIDRGNFLIQEGADIIDIGGESTRPGAMPVSVDEELDRVLPVIEGLKGSAIPISIDTRRSLVMKAALASGATIINDISALGHDADAIEIAAVKDAKVVLMHMLGEPQTMQDNPIYEDASLDIYDYLEERVEACEAGGIERTKLIIDPGIGFGKTLDHNLRILHDLAIFHGLGCAVMLGASRKSFIGHLGCVASADRRLPGSLTSALWATSLGVQILRVHDVAETRQAITVWESIVSSRRAWLDTIP